ncbi:MAG: flagellar motor switch protein FliN [Bryobacteraceae bacterium]|nr:flagellar motor switch protein FliN [Bryobacteraceae bacterium]
MADRRGWLFEQFARKLAECAEGMLGAPVTASLAAGPPEELAAPLVWEQGFDLGDGCQMTVAAPESAWDKIGGEALKAAGVDELDPDSVRGTYLEILSQTLSSVASEIGGVLSRNVSPVDGREAPYAASAMSQAVALTLNGETVTLQVGADARLVAALEARPPAASSPATGQSDAGRPDAGRPTLSQELDQEHSERQDLLNGSKTLDLLLDVELPVSVSFGRASVPLKDVLKLTSGSIVELNRGVTDPVELIVNNCVIARGEVVVVEGNYGVRIQQIISARERLRTLN